MSTYTLPDLPYAYDALEPHIDERTMRLHHSKHHQGYVDGANTALEQLDRARRDDDFGSIKSVSRDLAFNLSGHRLHSIFWTNMTPESAREDAPDWLRGLLEDHFGSFDAFKSHFSAAASGVEGSGWGILAWETDAERLIVTQAEKHQNLTVQGYEPVLVIDVWEHAYYLKHQNDRGAYVESWWNVVNWRNVAERVEHARAGELVATS